MSASRVVVTGGSGFVGGHLVDRLLARGDEVTVFDAVPPAGPVAADVRFVPGDVLDPDALAKAVEPGTDVVYHLAAVVGVDEYLARPLDVIDINFTGTRNVLEAAAAAGTRVVAASTSEVFGKNPAVPWREDDDRVLGSTSADRWSYSTSKALTEHLVLAFSRRHGLAASIVRYFNVYGPRQRPAFLISRSVHRALNGRPLVVYDEGRQTRCFTYVGDAVSGTVLAGVHPRAVGEVFNIGSMVENTVGAAIGLVAELTGVEEIVHVATGEKLGKGYEDLSRRIPHNGKASELLGWSCPTGLREGVESTIAWARDNRWWLDLPDSGAA
ncbi:NAD-dependent epimerase/dehydratase family protein [Rhizohabitans arisaemae]|uniref:NAD-dependent epimerase/dehydratase family protein n=1 Tax=Rhizohabitans arisaemae TaxID=2720610 RepID=UPI0024B2297D|nr:NAD-dependent epimerase/dehydratase family protein [Rhizohabitans arisaemae]